MEYQPGSDPFNLPPDEPATHLPLEPAKPRPAQMASLRPKRRRGPLMAIAGFVVVLLLVGGGAFAAHSWLSTTSQTAAERIPATVDVYVGIDLVRLQSGEAKDLIDTLGRAASPDNASTVDTAIDELDRTLSDELGVTFTDDIEPWLGRTIGAGLMLPSTEDLMTVQPDFLVALEVRDDAKADDFLDTIIARNPTEFTAKPSANGRLWSDREATAELWHGDGIILIGTTGMVESAMAMDPSRSLAALAEFKTLTSELPSSRVATVYLHPQSLTSTLGTTFPEGQTGAVATSVDMAADGFTLDVVAGSSEATAAAYGLNTPADTFLSRLDDHTIGFFQMGSVADMYDQAAAGLQTVLDSMASDPSTTGSAPSLEDELNQTVGFDVVNGLIRKLDGPTGIAAFRHDDGDPWGFMGAFATSDPAGVKDALARLAMSAGNEGLDVTRVGDRYSLDGATVGVVGSWLAVGNDQRDLDLLAAGTPSTPLTTTEKFRQAIAGLPDGRRITAYVDIQSLADEFATDPDLRRTLIPYRSFVMGAADDGTTFRATMFLAIGH